MFAPVTSPVAKYDDDRRRIPLLVVLGLLAGAVPALAQPLSVEWVNERLTVSGSNVPLTRVLEEIGRRTGSVLTGVQTATQPVTVDIRNAGLVQALRSLLADADVNYLYIPTYSDRSGAPTRVALWIYGAQHGDRLARRAGPVAVTLVDDAGSASVAAPVAATGDDEAQLVAEGHFDVKATESGLLSLAQSPNPDVRIRAFETLALQNSPAGHAAIRAGLDDPHPFVRAEATELLAHLPQPAGGALKGALALLEHPDAAVRFAGVATLTDDLSEPARFALERALNDDDKGVRDLAAQALRQDARTKRKR